MLKLLQYIDELPLEKPEGMYLQSELFGACQVKKNLIT